MFKPDVNRVSKGMIFAGCSFTWGQGLYYYSNLPTLREPPPYHYDQKLLKDSHYEYMKSIRYPRLVANHFKTFEVCQSWNGGSTYSITNYWKNRIKNLSNPPEFNERLPDEDNFDYDWEDFSCIIYQCTQWIRNPSSAKLFLDKNNNPCSSSHTDTMKHPKFFDWLEEQKLTIDDYIRLAMEDDIKNIKSFLMKFHERGIKTYILSWPSDMVPYITADSWLKDRFITFNYKGFSYTNIEDMMGEPNDSMLHPELTICTDYQNFKVTPKDHHPSRKCHQIIAENIIKRLENQ